MVVPNRVGSIPEPLRGSIPFGAQTRGVAAPPRATVCHPSGVGADPVFTTPTRRTPRRARGLHPGGMAAISPGSAKRHPGFGVKGKTTPEGLQTNPCLHDGGIGSLPVQTRSLPLLPGSIQYRRAAGYPRLGRHRGAEVEQPRHDERHVRTCSTWGSSLRGGSKQGCNDSGTPPGFDSSWG